MRFLAHRWPRSSVRIVQLLLIGAVGFLPAIAAAQNIVSVPFTNGFLGTRGSSAGSANNVLTFGTLGIARIFFVQNSSSNQFEIQGNDIPGVMRIVRADGTTVDFPASVNWRNSGGTTYLVGILPRPAVPYDFAYAGGSVQIADGTLAGGTSIGGYVAAYTGTVLTDGSSTSGNAALAQVLDGLNAYLGTVLSSRPQGPVTVNALTTSNATPTLTGNVTLADYDQLTVTVNNVQYDEYTSPALSVSDGQWSLALTAPLSNGTYDVAATVTNVDGFTLSDATTNELRVATTLTVSGSFTANSKLYDGTTVATGSAYGLELQGVPDGQSVSISSMTLQFQTAAAGDARTVIISAITLSGANAAGYAVDLTGAPTASAGIIKRPLTVTGLAAENRAYDGTTTATLSGSPAYANFASGENFPVSGEPLAQFASASVGSGKVVTVSGLGVPSDNYTVTQPTLSASIAPRTLTIAGTFTANNKTFDSTMAATIDVDGLTLTGVIPDDDVSLTQLGAQFATADVGTDKTVSITSATLVGNHAFNYTLSLIDAPTTTAHIVSAGPTVLRVTGDLQANSRAYDGTAIATGSAIGLLLEGVINGHDVQIGTVSLRFADAEVGQDRTVEIASVTLVGNDAASYIVSLACSPTATASITPRALTVAGVSVQSKVYDGTMNATLLGTPNYVGLVTPDEFAVAGTHVALFSSAAVGAGRAVTVTGIQAPSANYSVTQPSGLTGSIVPRVVTIGGAFTARSRLFDGTTSAQLIEQSLVLVNAVQGQVLGLANIVVAFASASVGTDKLVSITSATLNGGAASNYTLSLENAPHSTASILAANPPSAPRSLTGVAGNRQVTVTWTAPADEGCAAIDGWVVEYRVNGGEWLTRSLTSLLPMQFTITPLINNMPVDVRVAAANACGTSAFATAGTFVPEGPATTDNGGGGSRPPSVGPGQTEATSGGESVPVTTTVVQDTTMRVAGDGFSLGLLAFDDAGLAIPVDTPVVLQLEQGGRAHTSGSGFAPGTLVTLYLYGTTGEPILLGRVVVLADGTFANMADVPSLPEGNYTLQVNGITSAGTPRSVAIGVQVVLPPPDLELTAVPSTNTPSAGDSITITITVTNRGTGPAIDVVIPRAFREAGFEMVNAVPEHGTYDASSQLWRIPRIEAGASARLLLTAIVQPPEPEFRP